MIVVLFLLTLAKLVLRVNVAANLWHWRRAAAMFVCFIFVYVN